MKLEEMQAISLQEGETPSSWKFLSEKICRVCKFLRNRPGVHDMLSGGGMTDWNPSELT